MQWKMPINRFGVFIYLINIFSLKPALNWPCGCCAWIQQIIWFVFAVTLACVIGNNHVIVFCFHASMYFISRRWTGRLWWWVQTVVQDWTEWTNQTCLTPPRNPPTTRLTLTMRFPSQRVSFVLYRIFKYWCMLMCNIKHFCSNLCCGDL